MYRTKTILLLAEINLTEFVKNQIFATAEPKTHAFETKLRAFSLSPHKQGVQNSIKITKI